MHRTLLCAAALVGFVACDDPLGPSGSTSGSDPVATGSSVAAHGSRKNVIRAQDLGNLGGSFALAIGINERTQVVGFSTTPTDGFQHPYLWTAGRGMRDLGTLGGDNAIAFEVNKRADVVGFSEIAGNAVTHAFLWRDGHRMQDLGTLGGRNSTALGVNDQRQVVGEAQTAKGRSLPYIWKPGRGMRSLGIVPAGGPASEGSGQSINEAGEVAGFIALQGLADPSSPYRAFRWTPRGGMRDLGTLGGDVSRAWGINDGGDVVGESSDATGASQAFLWTQRHGMQGLGSLGGDYATGFSINKRRVVVGESLDQDGRLFPFIWTKEAGMRALPVQEVGGIGGAAVGINEQNEISGLVFTPDGNARAVLWRPKGGRETASIAERAGEFEAAAGAPHQVGGNWCALRRTYARHGHLDRTAVGTACLAR